MLSLPVSLFILAATVRRRSDRLVTAGLGTVAAFLISPFLLMCALDVHRVIEDGQDKAYELIDELGVGSARYRLYRTNFGATTSFGVVFRQERDFLPGLELVRFIESFHPARDAAFVATSSGRAHVRLEAHRYGQEVKLYEFLP
jgi:hypothetical protein